MEMSALGKTFPAEPRSGFTRGKHHDDVAGEKSDPKRGQSTLLCVEHLFKSALQRGAKRVLIPLPNEARGGTPQDLSSASSCGGPRF